MQNKKSEEESYFGFKFHFNSLDSIYVKDEIEVHKLSDSAGLINFET